MYVLFKIAGKYMYVLYPVYYNMGTSGHCTAPNTCRSPSKKVRHQTLLKFNVYTPHTTYTILQHSIHYKNYRKRTQSLILLKVTI